MYHTHEAYDWRERDMEPVRADGVSVYEKYAGRWAWSKVRNGCGQSSNETYATRDEAVRAAWVVARCNGLSYICR